MYLGKPLFVHVMDFLPWKTFHRIVDRYGGDHALLQILSLTLFEKLPLKQAVSGVDAPHAWFYKRQRKSRYSCSPWNGSQMGRYFWKREGNSFATIKEKSWALFA
jgi:hypothetical protein